MDRDKYYFGIAQAVAAGAKCTRAQVGAVIVNDNRIVGTGKNGAAPGLRECTEGACPRGRHYPDAGSCIPLAGTQEVAIIPEPTRCGCGHDWPCPEYIEPGGNYDSSPGLCIANHAELNACIDAGRKMAKHGIIYVTREPCYGCIKVIQAAGILRLAYPDDRGSVRSLDYPFVRSS